MHYDIEYKGTDTQETQRKACVDVLEFVGSTTYKMLGHYARLVNAGKADPSEFRVGCMFAGVQGYPVEAMLERYK